MEASRTIWIAVLVASVTLMVPYGELLLTTWNGDSKAAAPSLLSFAAALVLAWRKRDALAGVATPGRPALGLAALVAMAALYAVSVVFDVRLFAGFAAVGLLGSLLYLRAGMGAVRLLLAPMALLALATPLPAFVEAEMTRTLVAATVAVTPLVLTPIVGAIEVEGALLHLPGGTVAVVDDCSGLGGVLLFVPLAIVLISLHGPMPLVRSVALLVASLVLAFAGSLVRVWISAGMVHFGSEYAHSDTLHEILGIVTLLLALAALVVVGGRLAPDQEDDADSPQERVA